MTPRTLILIYQAKVCPCCGAQLDFEPWAGEGRFQSDEICPCCAIQFGYTDHTQVEDITRRIEIYTEIRENWVRSGMKWQHEYLKPRDWDPIRQLDQLIRMAEPAAAADGGGG